MNKKKYYFIWYNYMAQSEQADFVLAENETEATQIAVLIMKFFAGDRFTEDDIITLIELNDDYFYTMDKIKERYSKCNKEFIIPEVYNDWEEIDDKENS